MSGNLRIQGLASRGREEEGPLSYRHFRTNQALVQDDWHGNIHVGQAAEAMSLKCSPWGALESGFQVKYTGEESRAPGGKARPRTPTLGLEGEPQRELDLARNIVLAGYSPKIFAAATAAIRRTELRAV